MEHTGLLFLFTCQPTKSFNFSSLGVNVRAHILRKNYSRNFSSVVVRLNYSMSFQVSDRLVGYILNKSEHATHELFAIYMQNDASQ